MPSSEPVAAWVALVIIILMAACTYAPTLILGHGNSVHINSDVAGGAVGD